MPSLNKTVVTVFFLFYLVLGLFIIKDYGVSWDESIQRTTGLLTHEYVFEGNDQLLKFPTRFYGTAFEWFLIGAEKLLKITDDRSVFLMRHTVTFLLFFLSVIFFYRLARKTFNHWGWGLLGGLLLILNPRIFSHSFYNSKDIAFLSIFIISIYTLRRLLDKKSYTRVFIHALVCALLIDIRILGVLVPILTIVFYGVAIAQFSKERKSLFLKLVIFVGAFIGFMILFWPILWQQPVGQIMAAFKQMSQFPWDGRLLYLGEYFRGTQLPWHYLPVWIAVSTPILFLFLSVVGLSLFLKKLLSSHREGLRDWIIYFCWLVIPLSAVFILNSVVYDAWRQLFFIYPAIVLFALCGLRFFWERIIACSKQWLICVFIFVITLGVFEPLWFMISSHPHQNVYFNYLAGNSPEKIKERFELDYWGLSFKQGLEYLLRENPEQKQINVYVEHWPGIANAQFLSELGRARINIVEATKNADYLITNFRWQSNQYEYPEIYSIKVRGIKILAVYQLK